MLTALAVLIAPGASEAAGGATDTGSTSSSETDSILAGFENPSTDAKPMARLWFPDAGAGKDAESLKLVSKQIEDMAAGGFGGAEIAFLADSKSFGGSSRMTNDELASYGFGSRNWKNIVTQLLTTANSIEGGFKIDFTITSHWPPIVNTIDPNDKAQQKEASQAYTKITAADLSEGKADLPLPTTRTKDFSNTTNLIADFVFTDDFSSADVAKVTSLNDDGTPVLEYASLEDVTGATSKKKVTAAEASAGVSSKVVNGVRYAGSAAGVPDQDYATAHGLDYQDTLDKFGPEPADPNFTGKIDADGNRKRMADWQYNYQVALSSVSALDGYTPSEGDALAVGDYVLIGNYYRGTGQIMSGGSTVTQHNRTYATDYFSSAGVQKLFDFWDANILDDNVIALLKENGKQGTSIFEDSIEIHADTPLWTYDLPDEFASYMGRELGSDEAVLAASDTSLFDDSDAVTRTREDYNLVLGHLYQTEHAALIKKWAASFGYTYRAQAYTLSGLDIDAAASAVDIPEGDNSSAGDGLRELSGAVNLTGKQMLSMESCTFACSTNSTWEEILKVVNSDASDGVSRAILHGSSFARTFDLTDSTWPGWNFLNFMANNGRQIYWSQENDFSDYVARNQAVLQAGTAKVDVAVLVGSDAGYQLQSGDSLRSLMNKGFSYNLITESLLSADNATVSNGVLDADGPAYKAIVVKQATRLSVASVDKLIAFAKAGLPVLLYDVDIDRVYGTSHDSNTDSALAAALTELESLDNVSSAPSDAEVGKLLKAEDVSPAVSYSIANLQVNHRHGSDGEFYSLYNDSTTDTVSGEVTLSGSGNPYVLDASTGAITPVGRYTRSGDTVTVDVSLLPENSTILAVASGDAFPKAASVWATSADGTVAVDAKGKISLVEEKAGSYAVTLSDGTTKTVTVDAMPDTVDLSDDWALSLESWGPDAEANTTDPTVSAKTTIDFADTGLKSWSELAATSDQLSTMGVDSMAKVSGIGTYSRSFTLPDTWTSADGATLNLAHGSDMITGVTVNGTTFDEINQFTDSVDIGSALKSGANTITITEASTLANRASSAGAAYGLTGVSIVPNVSVPLTDKAASATTLSAPAQVAFGQAARATVRVTGTDGAAATGGVELAIGDTTLTATLHGGKATFALPRTLRVGTATLTATYVGDDDVQSSTATARLVVVKASVKPSLTLTKKPTSKRTGSAIVKLRSAVGGPTAPGGSVTVRFTKGKSKKSVTRTLVSGAAKVVVPKLAKGTWKVFVKYAGDTGYKPLGQTKVRTVKVTK
ncbi:glycosyl hydrolase [Nocardioides sp. Kera G14]|uniref:glycosyl hydrolase n=1 Tax=Nocardioides sp. Kera G14 TaxID=2884264 RepID=UPI001D0F566F|nr:glycosyl hydrolase [Nocardioides sp. Kera G14]UDY25189.1 Ig-like domain repeat protein [Nocardioides sp. Kera G14]